jgi:hypothetical protein
MSCENLVALRKSALGMRGGKMSANDSINLKQDRRQWLKTIIPADSHSGGAKAAKVADYIEQRIRESVDEQQKALWREGLRLMESMSQHYNGKSFVNSSTEEKIAVVKVLSDNAQLTELPEVQFFHELKSLTVRGYYTSKIGIHDDLEYKGNRILMEFVGCGDPTPPTT